MKSNPAKNKGENYPVERVSFEDAKKFCELLTEFERGNGRISNNECYSLPTYEQWLHVASCSNSNSEKKKNLTIERLKNQENLKFDYNDQGTNTASVGSKLANEFGVFDLLGNVAEWLDNKQVAGGSFGTLVRSDDDSFYFNTFKINVEKSSSIGFRIVRNIPGAQPLSPSEPQDIPAIKPIPNESVKSRVNRIKVPFSAKDLPLKKVLEAVSDFSEACDEKGFGVEVILEDPDSELAQKRITIECEAITLKSLLEEIFKQANADCFERDGKLFVVPAKEAEVVREEKNVSANTKDVPIKITISQHYTSDEPLELRLERIKSGDFLKRNKGLLTKADSNFFLSLAMAAVCADEKHIGVDFLLDDPQGKLSERTAVYPGDVEMFKNFLEIILAQVDAKYSIRDNAIVITPKEEKETKIISDESVKSRLERIKIGFSLTWEGKVDQSFLTFLKGIAYALDEKHIGVEFALRDPSRRISNKVVVHNGQGESLKEFLKNILREVDAKYTIQDDVVVIVSKDATPLKSKKKHKKSPTKKSKNGSPN